MQKMIPPSFTPDNLDGNARQLSDLFQLRDASAVPVEHFAVVSDNIEMEVAVGPDTHDLAILLLYFMTKSAAPTFELTHEMRSLAIEYFGPKMVADARNPSTKHRIMHHAIRALLGHTVYIRLTLKDGYREHLVTSRSPEEVIRHAWERRHDIDRQSPEPFLRRALVSFFQDIESGTLRANEADGHWPTPEWTGRALILVNLLKP